MDQKRVEFFPEKLHRGGFLTLYPTYLEECIDYVLKNDVKGIHIDSYFHNMTDDKGLKFFQKLSETTELRIDLSNYEKDNLDFLFALKKLKTLRIGINTKTVKNVEGIYSLNNLKALGLVTSGPKINVAKISTLEDLSFHWDNKRIEGVSNLPNLKELSIEFFNAKSKEFEELPSNNNITKLKLLRGNQNTFLRFPHFKNLERLETDYYNKLEKLEGIGKLSPSLKSLQIENSKKVNDHDIISKLKNIEILNLWSCGSIKNLEFISNLKYLKRFNFYNSDVKNGDLTPILLHPKLEYIGFNNKKHYSHKIDEIQKELEKMNAAANKS